MTSRQMRNFQKKIRKLKTAKIKENGVNNMSEGKENSCKKDGRRFILKALKKNNIIIVSH